MQYLQVYHKGNKPGFVSNDPQVGVENGECIVIPTPDAEFRIFPRVFESVLYSDPVTEFYVEMHTPAGGVFHVTLGPDVGEGGSEKLVLNVEEGCMEVFRVGNYDFEYEVRNDLQRRILADTVVHLEW